MDKNGKIGKFSIIDILAILLVVVIAAGTIYKFYAPGAKIETSTSTLKYTLKINGVRDFTYEYYTKEQDLKCFDKKTGEYLGVVKNVYSEPFEESMYRYDGTISNVPRPGVIVVYLDVEVEGTETETAYFARGTYEIKSGSEVHLNTKYVDVVATVSNVSGS